MILPSDLRCVLLVSVSIRTVSFVSEDWLLANTLKVSESSPVDRRFPCCAGDFSNLNERSIIVMTSPCLRRTGCLKVAPLTWVGFTELKLVRNTSRLPFTSTLQCSLETCGS